MRKNHGWIFGALILSVFIGFFFEAHAVDENPDLVEDLSVVKEKISEVLKRYNVTFSNPNLNGNKRTAALKRANSEAEQILCKRPLADSVEYSDCLVKSTDVLEPNSPPKQLETNVSKIVYRVGPKQMAGLPNLELDPVKFIPPNEFRDKNFSPCIRNAIINYCKLKEKETLHQLDQSIADVAVKYVPIERVMNRMLARLMAVVEADALYQISEKGSESKNIKPTQIRHKADEILSNKIGNCTVQEAGCVGKDVATIRKIFTNGNLREKWFIFYKMDWSYVGTILANPEYARGINHFHAGLSLPGTGDLSVFNPTNPFEEGIYAKLTKQDQLRKMRPPEERQAYPENVRKKTIADMSSTRVRIPLSAREIDFLQANGLPRSAPYPALPGEAWWEPQPNPSSHYSKHAQRTGIPQIAGISGTTDRMLTLAKFLGVDSVREMTLLRFALIGWMVDSADHSVHEIMTGAKSFLPYHFTPEFYKELVPFDPAVAKDIEKRQHQKGLLMPDEVAKECPKEFFKDDSTS